MIRYGMAWANIEIRSQPLRSRAKVKTALAYRLQRLVTSVSRLSVASMKMAVEAQAASHAEKKTQNKKNATATTPKRCECSVWQPQFVSECVHDDGVAPNGRTAFSSVKTRVISPYSASCAVCASHQYHGNAHSCTYRVPFIFIQSVSHSGTLSPSV